MIPPQCVSILRRQLDGTANTRPVLFLGGMSTSGSSISSNISSFSQRSISLRPPNLPPEASYPYLSRMPAAGFPPSMGFGMFRPSASAPGLQLGFQPGSQPLPGAPRSGPVVMRVMPPMAQATGGGAMGPRSTLSGGMPILVSGPRPPTRLLSPISYFPPVRSRSAIAPPELNDDSDDDVILMEPK